MENTKFNILVSEHFPEEHIIDEILGNIANIKFTNKIYEEIPKDEIKDVDAIILGGSKITRTSIEYAKRLKIIGRVGVGVDNVDIEACAKRGIIVFNTPGLNAESVADLTIALILAVARKLFHLVKITKEGSWDEKLSYVGIELYGKTIGIVGLGNIGQAVARRAKGFNMRILYYDRKRKVEAEKKLGAIFVDFRTLLRESDIVTLHVPLTKETRHMIGERELKLMKPTAILINTARGEVVDYKALYKALKEGWIMGAGIDVYEKEPAYNHPLFNLDNVVVTPHVGDLTYEAYRRMLKEVCYNIKNYLLYKKMPKTLVIKSTK